VSSPRRIVLLRHGRTAHNATGRIQGQLDVPLDEVGEAQAVVVAGALAEAVPHAVVSSDLARARRTAEAVAARAGVPLVLDVRLREISLGAWEGLTSEEARWVLLDFADVVVHVQHEEERIFYALERLWKDCPVIPFVDRDVERAAGRSSAS